MSQGFSLLLIVPLISYVIFHKLFTTYILAKNFGTLEACTFEDPQSLDIADY